MRKEEFIRLHGVKSERMIREYVEDMGAQIYFDNDIKRWVVKGLNECGYNWTLVDLLDVISWVNKNNPELLTSV